MKIGVIGQGFVGSAITSTFSKTYDILTYDKFKSNITNSNISEISRNCDIIFVCVPTPMNDDGSADVSIVEEVISQISSICTKGIIVIKSTIPPRTTETLSKKYNIHCVFNPEFLNAATAIEDFLNQTYLILGGEEEDCKVVEKIYRYAMPGIKAYYITDSITAEAVKYVKNCFFATKVSFANEMYQIMEKLDVDYQNMIEILKSDERVGWEHWKVPGPSPTPEGKLSYGFGGMCLPKDLSAFRIIAKQLGVNTKVLDATWNKNLEVRPDRDWEKVPGVRKLI